MPAVLVNIIGIQKGAVLLDYEHDLPGFENGVQLFVGQF
jgi:hypothetical protein